MRRDLRNKFSILETVLAKHNAAETRTLADLRRAGFKFQTVAQAYQTLQAQRTLHMFTEAQLDLAIRVLNGKAVDR